MDGYGLRKGPRSAGPALVSLTLVLLGFGAATGAATLARAQRELSVTVIGDPRDVLAGAVDEAIAFWNQQLERQGAGVRLGPVRYLHGGESESVLRELQNGELDVRSDDALPGLLAPIPGDVVVALSDADLMSFGVPWRPRAKGFVALRRSDVPPLSLPNVARNAAAHELGHVLGLDHNSDPATLMCGRPAPCRPRTFASDSPRFFPLTENEERRLRALWPR